MSEAGDLATLACQARGSGDHAPAVAAVASAPPPEHIVHFYDDDELLASAVAGFLGPGLPLGDHLVLIATASHAERFRRHLEAAGHDVAAASRSGQLLILDAHDTLDLFMRDGEPDPPLFDAEIGGLLARHRAATTGAGIRAYGEMVDVLWRRGERTAALRLEELWTSLQQRHDFSLLCAYALGGFYKEASGLARVCQSHTRVADAKELRGPARAQIDERDAGQLAREIAEREEIERALRASLRDLRQKDEELRASEEQLRDFVENATIGLHRVAGDGTILWANRAELALLGYAAEEYVGHQIAEFHVDQDVIDEILARLTRGEPVEEYEARLRAKDGAIKHVVINSSACRRDGRIIHTRCFTRDITARRMAEEAARRSEQQIRTITDRLPVLVSFVGADRRYQFVSAAYERWFDRPKAELLGRTVAEVVGERAYAVLRPYLDRALAGEEVSFDAPVPYARGLRHVAVTYRPQSEDGQGVTGVVVLIQDVTEKRALERLRAEAAEQAERLLAITGAIANAVTTAEVFEAVVDRIAAAVGAATSALWLLDDDGRTVRLVRSVGYADERRQPFDELALDASPSIPALDTIRRGTPIWISSRDALVRDYPNLAAVVTPGRFYRVACLPLASQGRTIGVLGLSIDEEREITDDDRSFLLLVARYAGQAIERLRILDAERRSRARADAAAARLALLSRASRTFVDADLELERRLDDIVRELASALGGCVGIALLEADGLLHTRAVHHPDPEAERWLRELTMTAPLAVGEGMTGKVVQTGCGVLIDDADARTIADRAAPPYRAFLERFPIHGMLCAPLRARGRVIGAVNATRGAGAPRYTDDDLALLEELAERAASAIENGRLHRENVQARARAEHLYRFAQTVVSADRLDDVFEAALDALTAALGTPRAAILVYDDQEVMRFRAWRGLSEDYRRAVEGHSPWPRNASAPEAVLVEDVLADAALAAYLPLFRSEGIGSLAFIPLVNRGRLIGKFMVYHAEAHHYSRTELELAGSIANHLASVTARFGAFAKLEETIRYNELFAGVLAHDLRNPLAAMMMAASTVLVQAEGEGDRSKKSLARIVSSGQRMSRMVEQLLDFTRARSGGGIEIQPRAVNLADVSAHAIGELEVTYPDWKIVHEVVGDLDGSWDPDRLAQIVSNLVANAGQHGEVERGVVVRLDGRRADAVTLSVHNGGVIPPAILPRLFDPFRGTRYSKNQSRGLGLGLYIVRELVRAHGGSVEVVSTESDGTAFTITLPRVARQSAAFGAHA